MCRQKDVKVTGNELTIMQLCDYAIRSSYPRFQEPPFVSGILHSFPKRNRDVVSGIGTDRRADSTPPESLCLVLRGYKPAASYENHANERSKYACSATIAKCQLPTANSLSLSLLTNQAER